MTASIPTSSCWAHSQRCPATALVGHGPPAEGDVLLQLKANFGSPATLTTWRSGSDPCSGGWLGVSCSWIVVASSSTSTSGTPQQFVTQLHLSSTGLLGLISSSISDLVHMRNLDLGSNSISGMIPASLGELNNLEILDLSSNELTGTIPDYLSNLVDLQQLYLQNNSLTGGIDMFSSLQNLNTIDVSDNLLVGSVPVGLQSVQSQNFRGNNLCGYQGGPPCANTSLSSMPPSATNSDGSPGSPPGSASVNATDGGNLLCSLLGVYCSNSSGGSLPPPASPPQPPPPAQLASNSNGASPSGSGGGGSSQSQVCTAGQRQACFCGGQLLGIQVCLVSNTLGACNCPAGQTVDATWGTDASPTAQVPGPAPRRLSPPGMYYPQGPPGVPAPQMEQTADAPPQASPPGLHSSSACTVGAVQQCNCSRVSTYGLQTCSTNGTFGPCTCGSVNGNVPGTSRLTRAQTMTIVEALGGALLGAFTMATLIMCCAYRHRQSRQQASDSGPALPLSSRDRGSQEAKPATPGISIATLSQISKWPSSGPKLEVMRPLQTKALHNVQGAHLPPRHEVKQSVGLDEPKLLYEGELPSGLTACLEEVPKSARMDEETFKREMERMGKMRHMNVLQLVGHRYGDVSALIAMEYVEEGENLAKLLAEQGNTGCRSLTWDARMKAALGIARALSYAHSLNPPVVHGLLRTKMVVLDKTRTAKVGGFVSSLLLRWGSQSSVILTNEPSFAAPELLQGEPPTTLADVYAFGVILVELLCGTRARSAATLVPWARPFLGDVRRLPAILDVPLSEAPRDELALVGALTALCIEEDPKLRCSASHAVEQIQKMQAWLLRKSMPASAPSLASQTGHNSKGEAAIFNVALEDADSEAVTDPTSPLLHETTSPSHDASYPSSPCFTSSSILSVD
eukprot:SM000290S10900  [mRNA]  locus=s290:58363:63841:- [translate_table: standard]